MASPEIVSRPDFDEVTVGLDANELDVFTAYSEAVAVPEKFDDTAPLMQRLVGIGYDLSHLQQIAQRGQDFGIADTRWRRS